MATPIVVPLAGPSVGGQRRSTTPHVVSAVKKENDQEKEPGLLKRATTANAVQASPSMIRKKLPWLDNARAKRGWNDHPSNTDATAFEVAEGENVLSRPSNAITPSTPRRFPPTSESNTNDDRGLNVVAPAESARVLSSQRAVCASSDYSEPTSDSEQPMPAALPQQDPSSYEKLVMDPHTSRTQAQDQHHHGQTDSKAFPRAVFNSSRSTEVARQRHHGTTRLKPKPSLCLGYEDSSSNSDQRRRCKSCDASVTPRPVQPKSLSSSHYGRGVRGQGRSRRKSDAGARHGHQTNELAVIGLESLLEEALAIARSAAKAGRADDISGVLNQATFVLKEPAPAHSGMAQGSLRVSTLR